MQNRILPNKTWILIVALVVLAVGLYAFRGFISSRPEGVPLGSTPLPAPTPPPAGEPAPTPASANSKGAIAGYQGVPVATLTPDPNVVRQISPEAHQAMLKELREIAARLSSGAESTDDWMRAAQIKHFYNDDPGARDIYEHLGRIWGSPIPMYNLALLYGYTFKEQEKAKAKFEEAIRRDPVDTSFYIGFADFERDIYKDLAAAEKILLEGLAKVPTDVDLMKSLASNYALRGGRSKAIEYYEKALASGQLKGSIVDSIHAEIEKLKQQS